MSWNSLLGLGLIAWFVLLAAAELVWRPGDAARSRSNDGRLVTNFGLAALILATSAVFPLAGIVTSVFANQLDIGIARHVAIPWVAVFILLLLVDSFAGYWIHRLMHRTSICWRIHRVHHTDEEVDVSTSLRNHPLELVVTMPASALVILVTGAPVSAVAVLQTILVGSAIWQHADILLPERLDRMLSTVIVTQRVHRLHHNPERSLHDNNYGELLMIWDRLFGTFTPGRTRQRVGLDDQVARPDGLLQQIWSPVHSA